MIYDICPDALFFYPFHVLFEIVFQNIETVEMGNTKFFVSEGRNLNLSEIKIIVEKFLKANAIMRQSRSTVGYNCVSKIL